jgi:AcrR family transcriptional regulator
MEKRRYRLDERAKQQEATRRKIVEATAELHARVGPAATTISAIAERAGVQRLTVYRHFPDEKELFAACSALSDERHPAPDPALWSEIGEPAARAQAALGALYEYYAGDAGTLALVLRDAEGLPALHEVLTPFREYLAWMADDLAARWDAPGEATRVIRAAAGFAVDFWTWRSLAAQGLTPHECARLMAALIRVAGEA